MAMRGVPERIRSDSGPAFTAKVACDWLKRMGVKTLFIEPGPPLDNDYVEDFNGRLADELPERDVFCTLLAAKVLIERWRCCCDAARPHNSLGLRPHAPEAIAIWSVGSRATPLRLPPCLGRTKCEPRDWGHSWGWVKIRAGEANHLLRIRRPR